MELLSIINKFVFILFLFFFFVCGIFLAPRLCDFLKQFHGSCASSIQAQNDRLDRSRSVVIGAGFFDRSFCLFFVIQ
jgi:hypothetical protein